MLHLPLTSLCLFTNVSLYVLKINSKLASIIYNKSVECFSANYLKFSFVFLLQDLNPVDPETIQFLFLDYFPYSNNSKVIFYEKI